MIKPKLYVKESFLLNSRLRDGDQQAFLHIYDTHSKGLYHFVRKFIQNTDTADDIVHDAFLSLWNARENIKTEHPIKNYIYRITRNLVYKKLKEQVKFLSVQDEVVYLEEQRYIYESAEESFIDHELQKIYDVAVEKLPPQRKRIFIMARQEGFSHKEIAEELGISVNTVKEHMSLAMHFMRDYIAKEYDVYIQALLFLFFLS